MNAEIHFRMQTTKGIFYFVTKEITEICMARKAKLAMNKSINLPVLLHSVKNLV